MEGGFSTEIRRGAGNNGAAGALGHGDARGGLVVAVGLESSRRRADERVLRRMGQPVVVDGLGLNALASGAGGPVVVLDEGTGGSLHMGAWIQPEVAGVARVVSVDSTHEDEDARLAELGYEEGHRMDLLVFVRFTAPLGVPSRPRARHLLSREPGLRAERAMDRGDGGPR